jgi:hypothetical protein
MMAIKTRYFKDYRALEEAKDRYRKRFQDVVVLSTLETGRGIRTEIAHGDVIHQ